MNPWPSFGASPGFSPMTLFNMYVARRMCRVRHREKLTASTWLALIAGAIGRALTQWHLPWCTELTSNTPRAAPTLFLLRNSFLKSSSPIGAKRLVSPRPTGLATSNRHGT